MEKSTSKKDNIPSFLIIGAPKCGTTSLFNYLQEHPDIYMSKNKEPKFLSFIGGINNNFNDPIGAKIKKSTVKTEMEYRLLFKNIPKKIKEIGEASVDTLYYYKNTIPVIKNFLGDPKIIIMLRKPTERAFSAYSHLKTANREQLSFEEALLKEEDRINSRHPFLWHYKNVGLYYNQVYAFLNNFSNVKIIFFEDFKEKTEYVVKDVFNFLSVKENIYINTAKIHRKTEFLENNLYSWLFKVFFKKKYLLKIILKRILPNKIFSRISFLAKNKIYTSEIKKIKMKQKTKENLNEFFKNDIIKLQELLKLDLKKWYI